MPRLTTRQLAVLVALGALALSLSTMLGAL